MWIGKKQMKTEVKVKREVPLSISHPLPVPDRKVKVKKEGTAEHSLACTFASACFYADLC
jgi:hypothetical protein